MTHRRVLLLRHGETEWNAENRWQGHGGGGLSPIGREQAERTAAFLAATRRDVTALVRSDLLRVAETAEAVAERFAVPVAVDPRRREIDVGDWSGRTHQQVRATDPDAYAAWCRGEDVRRGGGETDEELRTRVSEALTELLGAHGTVLVVTHGGRSATRWPRRWVCRPPVTSAFSGRRTARCRNWWPATGAGRWTPTNARSHLAHPPTTGAGHDKGRAVQTRPSW